jgi:rare lipoprotein A
MHRLARACVASLAGSAFISVASADPAPIVYAGQSQSAPVATQAASYGAASLSGGGDNSYGYGAQQRRPGATIDLRRSSTRSVRAPTQPFVVTQTASVASPVSQEEQAPDASAERPQWLEQERVGPPYEANGRTYVPTPEPGYSETGMASWYGPQFHGQRAANGEVFDQDALTAAHPTLPLNSLVQVTNLENGREVMVRITDRGPFVGGRLIDMSRGAAQVLGFEPQGHARVHVRYLGPAPRRAEDVEAASALQMQPEEGPASLLPPTPAPVSQPQIAQAPSAPVGSYYVQIGAFSDMSNVQRVRAEASAAGPVVVDTRRTTAGAELFRVRVGPWQSREEAEAARQTLASVGYGESVLASR